MRPKYVGIAANMRERIGFGEWAEELPTEEQLAAHYKVARGTARAAIANLVGEGLVDKRHGNVSIVVDQRIRRWIARVVDLDEGVGAVSAQHYLQDADKKGFQVTRKLDVRFERASEEISSALQIRPNTEVCVREETVHTQGEGTKLSTSYLSRKITRGSAMEDKDLAEDEMYELLERRADATLRFHEVIRGRTLNEYEKERLGDRVGFAFIIERTAILQDKPVEVNRTVLPMKHSELNYNWKSKRDSA